MGLRGPIHHEAHFPHGEYTASVLMRFVFLFALWIFYGMIPHVMPIASLLIVAALFALYGVYLFSRGNTLMGWLMGVAAGLNLILMALLAAGRNTLFVIIIIYAILLFDIVNVPKQS